MGILSTFEHLVGCMDRVSSDMHKLTKIIYAQQKQIHTLTNCVEQLQDLYLMEVDKER